MVESQTPARLWLIAGTQEGRWLADQLMALRRPTVVTVATPEAIQRYPQTAEVQVQSGRLTPETIGNFLRTEGIKAILDASHPHAEGISRLAIAAAQHYNLPYLRYERPAPAMAASTTAPVIELPHINDVLTDAYLAGERILITTGTVSLSAFQPWQQKSTLFCRILPTAAALETATAAGFPPERLIALWPPASLELEMALWRHWQLTRVITKASGATSGEAIKRQAAEALHISLVVIGRPPLAYPHQTSELAEALAFGRNLHLNSHLIDPIP